MKKKDVNFEKLVTKDEVKYIEYLCFDDDVLAIYSTKHGGISKGHGATMNLSFKLDSRENVKENFKIISKALGIPYENLTFSNQVHETNIRVVKEEDIGKGIHKEIDYASVDGLVTNMRKVPIVTLYADCLPIYLYDCKNKVIAMAHGGWRGSVNNIATKCVDVMIKEFGTDSENIIVVLGPCICEKCFEVGDEVLEIFNQKCIEGNIDKVTYSNYVNLKKYNEEILRAKGINKIFCSQHCTYQEDDLFFSHRKLGLKRGSQVGIMMLH